MYKVNKWIFGENETGICVLKSMMEVIKSWCATSMIIFVHCIKSIHS